jgi:topoisomerase IV subunit A
MSNHYEEDILIIEKYIPNKIFSAVFFDGEQKNYYLKRFEIEETSKYLDFIGENDNSKLICISDDKYPQLKIKFGGKHSNREDEYVDVSEFIGTKGYKARGKRLTNFEFKKAEFVEPLIKEELEEEKKTAPPIDLSGSYDGNQMSLF